MAQAGIGVLLLGLILGGGAVARQPPASDRAAQPGCFVCPASRPLCPTLSGCAEAYFQLRVCGFAGHDRDNDGIPCETLCGSSGRQPPPIPPACGPARH